MRRKDIIYLSLYGILLVIGIASFAYLLDADWEEKRFLKFLGVLAAGVVMIFAKEKLHKKYEMLKRK